MVSAGRRVAAPSSACSRKRSAISATVRPPTALMPAIDSRSATQRARGGGIGAGERGEHAGVFGSGAAGELERRKIGFQRAGAVEVLDQAALPGGRQVERGDQRREQADVAHADFGIGGAVLAHAVEREREAFGVGGLAVGAAERLDPGLQQFRAAVAAVAEHRAEIAIGRGTAGRGFFQVLAADRDGEVRAQAQLAAARVAGDEERAAQLLAGQLEEIVGRLQHGGLDAQVSRALVEVHEPVRAIGSRRSGGAIACHVSVLRSRGSERGLVAGQTSPRHRYPSFRPSRVGGEGRNPYSLTVVMGSGRAAPSRFALRRAPRNDDYLECRASTSRTASTSLASGTENCAGRVSRHSLLEAMASRLPGAFHQVLDLHFALGLLVAALDDDAGRAALVGIFQLRAHLAGAQIKLGVDVRVAQRLHHALIVGDAVLIEHGDDHGTGRGFRLELAEMLERGHEPRHADGESGGRHRLAAKARDESVIASAAADRTEADRIALVFGLKGQIGFVDRAGVIFEAADDGGVDDDAAIGIACAVN